MFSKKAWARIPQAKKGDDFAAFVKAGRKLGDLHCGYEKAKPWADCKVDVKAEQGELGAAGRPEVGPYQANDGRACRTPHSASFGARFARGISVPPHGV